MGYSSECRREIKREPREEQRYAGEAGSCSKGEGNWGGVVGRMGRAGMGLIRLRILSFSQCSPGPVVHGSRPSLCWSLLDGPLLSFTWLILAQDSGDSTLLESF